MSSKELLEYPEWKKNSIDQPGFELGSSDRIDLSGYLVHMTTKENLISILKNSSPDTGLIIADVPETNRSHWYQEKVACFTETPIHSLNFFRLRVFNRYKADQRYGVGFLKTKLIEKGVRPVLYLDEQSTLPKLKAIKKRVLDNESSFSSNELFHILRDQYQDIIPFVTPFDYLSPMQGYMWEREWRYSPRFSESEEEGGFSFSYSDIAIICCPNAEVSEFEGILGGSSQVEFYDIEQEYESIAEYMKFKYCRDTSISSIEDKHNFKFKIEDSIKNLEAYQKYINFLNESAQSIQSNINSLKAELDKLTEWCEQYCCMCNQSFETHGRAGKWDSPWNESEGVPAWLCSTCYSEMMDKINDPDS